MQYEPLVAQPITLPISFDWPAIMLVLVTAGITVRVLTGLGFWLIKLLQERMTSLDTSTTRGTTHLHAKGAKVNVPIGSGGT